MSDDLPAYHKPPVVEVALSVAFEPMPLSPPLVGLFWDGLYKNDLPDLQQVNPVKPQVEKFGAARTRLPQIQFELLEQPSPSRFWFKDGSGQNLLQVQPDWIARNWRHQEDGEEYPRYPSIREPFAADLANLRNFVIERGLDEPKPIQCEMVYVNHIVAGHAWADWCELSEVMRCWSDTTTAGFLPRIEESGFAAQYQIVRDDKPIGRFHVELNSGTRKSDDAKLFVLTLTARGEPLGSDIEGLLAFHDLGHEWIVRGFTDLTTERMHEEWERYQ
ncbi:MAG: TIGR04255 family protein [Acidimicrobiales bacterium]